MDEGDETFRLRLQEPRDAVIYDGDGVGVGTITDDDQTPQKCIQRTKFRVDHRCQARKHS